jgi:hypothetical protein
MSEDKTTRRCFRAIIICIVIIVACQVATTILDFKLNQIKREEKKRQDELIGRIADKVGVK